MANTYTQILYHIVFSTKERATVLRETRREEFFRYVWGVRTTQQPRSAEFIPLQVASTRRGEFPIAARKHADLRGTARS
ncbi:hypothetical protein [Prosthecobacter sp.]|uniref:hypothetical protein n=1 Tax=Prosthecobacter sp. TaxID=1965333 RepID=UPI00248956C6|nr:hypothetical protein [Prosthecobacter sp.]MDI1310660.1 hypothetical protein [Prosthecobacter sp.]